ncbi:MAG TPA: metalloregulator ArsR/SmtB family transcription factor [Chloroflexota bacterium]|nr:metalloregulator ArsR/SmtB family transcription factor [Chloroflexota bacterium]HZU07716.1 metalloregulator ArsR/SmtB family transcription factor [Chloroflexota bacterium]
MVAPSAPNGGRNGNGGAAPRPEESPLLRDAEVDALLQRIATGLCERIRLQLLAALTRGERSVTELTLLLGRTQPSVSKHLRVLRDQRLVRTRRERNRVFYRLASEELAGQAVLALIETLERALAAGQERRG